MVTLQLDLLQTLTLAAVVYYPGVKLRQRIGFLDRLNIPSAVVGGLLFAALVFALHDRVLNLALDTSAQPVLNVAFFTTIGMGASVALLRKGGVAVLVFLVFAIFACFAQNVIGIAVAAALRRVAAARGDGGLGDAGRRAGDGLAFAPLFEEAGLPGAGVIAITSAVFGIVCGGLAGNPVGTALIVRHGLSPVALPARELAQGAGFPRRLPAARAARRGRARGHAASSATSRSSPSRWDSAACSAASSRAPGLTLPAYIGAMIVASAVRNLDEATGWLGIDEDSMEFVGGVALNIFLVVALMDLKLWQLADQALPLFAILLAQLVTLVRARLLRVVPPHGPRLRLGRHGQRLHRLRHGHHGQRGGQHARAGGALRAGAPGLPGRARWSAPSSSISPTR